jgi:hypothetical protein
MFDMQGLQNYVDHNHRIVSEADDIERATPLALPGMKRRLKSQAKVIAKEERGLVLI